jgi:hypothetical protein
VPAAAAVTRAGTAAEAGLAAAPAAAPAAPTPALLSGGGAGSPTPAAPEAPPATPPGALPPGVAPVSPDTPPAAEGPSAGVPTRRVEKVTPDFVIRVGIDPPAPAGDAERTGTLSVSFLPAPPPDADDLPGGEPAAAEPSGGWASWPRLFYATVVAGLGAVVFYPRKSRTQ